MLARCAKRVSVKITLGGRYRNFANARRNQHEEEARTPPSRVRRATSLGRSSSLHLPGCWETHSHRPLAGRQVVMPSRMLVAAMVPLASGMAISTPDACKLYGHLAENQLYLDKAVGACCHSACSDCEWREPGGGYRFDMLKANFPKWLPCYIERDFEDERGCHVPVWSSTLFPDGATGSVSRADFDARFRSLEFTMPLGPKGNVKPEDAEPSAEALDALWGWLCDGEASDAVDAATALKRLQDMSLADDREGAIGEGPDFVDWKSFAKALGAAPFERW